MPDLSWRSLIHKNFDKLTLLLLITLIGATMVTLVRWNIAPEVMISVKDSYAALIGALIALTTANRHTDENFGAVLEKPKEKN